MLVLNVLGSTTDDRNVAHKLKPNDIRVPTASEPLRYDNLVVEPGHFCHNGRQFDFSDVRRLEFNWVVHTKGGVGQNQDMTLEFDIASTGQHVILKTNKLVFFAYHMFFSLKQKHRDLFSIYSYLAAVTFPSRLATYLEELDSRGHYTFDQCRFYADGRAVRGDLVLGLREAGVEVSRSYGQFHITRAKPQASTVLARMLGRCHDRIDVGHLVDKDVFYSLLEDVFGISFEQRAGTS